MARMVGGEAMKLSNNTYDILKYNSAEARAERLDRIKAKITELRDKATLQTTKAIYNAILALFDEED